MKTTVTNFGANVRFSPQTSYAPRSEEELLEILHTHASGRIRAIGRLHSWSEASVCPDVLVDLRHFDSVAIHEEDGQTWADIGAGCQIKQIVSELNKHGFTMPSLGLITEQALGGAMATGTHGSGRNSLSHYGQSLRLATYDPETGQPTIRTIDFGEELLAVRCSLGCLGIVTSIRLPIRKQYRVEEHFRRYVPLKDVLAAEEDFDLQQFFFIPWRWDFLVQHRREVTRNRSWLAPFYRLYWTVGMDVLLHWNILALARCLPRFCTKVFFRRLVPLLVPRHWKVVDRSDKQLTMRHHLFRHIEIEIFVRRSLLDDTLKFVRWLLEQANGNSSPLEEHWKTRLETTGDWDRLQQVQGRYCHHYPICIRKVLPDDTLISMASGEEPYYAVSFISYARPHERDGFFAFADVLARTTATLFESRPHWGKVCPLDPNTLASLYPNFQAFQKIKNQLDPQNRFGNAWTESLWEDEPESF